jgi:hypothetical protein
MRGGPRLPVLPDGIAVIARPDGPGVGLSLEVDPGTATLEHIARKVRALEAAYLGWRLPDRLGEMELLVAVVAPSRRRLASAWRATWPEVLPERRQCYRFGLIEELERRGAWEMPWVDLTDHGASWCGDGGRVRRARNRALCDHALVDPSQGWRLDGAWSRLSPRMRAGPGCDTVSAPRATGISVWAPTDPGSNLSTVRNRRRLGGPVC